jgi:hypothetical protein
MTTHQIGDRFTHGRTGTGTKYDIILGSDGYALQEVATGRNPLWWDAEARTSSAGSTRLNKRSPPWN